MITLIDEREEHAPAVERLLDRAYGEARWHKPSARLRRGRQPMRGLSLVAVDGQDLVGTVRLWTVSAAGRRSLLLGPLAVDPRFQEQGIGAALMEEALRRAEAAGEGSVMLVGDAAYYARFGFKTDAVTGLSLPGADRRRLLARELRAQALDGARGAVLPAAA